MTSAHGSWYLLQRCPLPLPALSHNNPLRPISLVISMVSGHGSRQGEEAAEIMAHLSPDLLSKRGFSTPPLWPFSQPGVSPPTAAGGGASWER